MFVKLLPMDPFLKKMLIKKEPDEKRFAKNIKATAKLNLCAKKAAKAQSPAQHFKEGKTRAKTKIPKTSRPNALAHQEPSNDPVPAENFNQEIH